MDALFYNNRNVQKGHYHAKGLQGDRTIDRPIIRQARNILSSYRRNEDLVPYIHAVNACFAKTTDTKNGASTRWALLFEGFENAGRRGCNGAIEFLNLLTEARDSQLTTFRNRDIHQLVTLQQRHNSRDQFTIKVDEIFQTTTREFWVRAKGAQTNMDLAQVPNFNDNRPVITFLSHGGIVQKLQTLRGNKEHSSQPTAATSDLTIEDVLPPQYKGRNKDIMLKYMKISRTIGSYQWKVCEMSIKERKPPTQRRN